jgi:hypothetical protein
MTNDEALDEMVVTFSSSTFVIRASSFLDVQIANIEGVVLDILPPRFDDIAHQLREHLVRFDRIVVIQVNLEQLALFRIHRGVEKLFRVHFTQAFESLDLDATPSDFDNFLVNFRN